MTMEREDKSLAFPNAGTLIGDTFETLLTQQAVAYSALSDALDAMRMSAPNGRNFVGDEAKFMQACREHDERIRLVTAVMDEYVSISRDIRRQRRRHNAMQSSI